jgi:hypothetical protein
MTPLSKIHVQPQLARERVALATHCADATAVLPKLGAQMTDVQVECPIKRVRFPLIKCDRDFIPADHPSIRSGQEQQQVELK